VPSLRFIIKDTDLIKRRKPMRLLRFKTADGHPALGARIGDEVINLTELGCPGTLDELLRHGAAGMASVKAAIEKSTKRTPLSAVTLLPPLHHPHKAFAIGLNYVDHASESNFQAPTQPIIFQRYPTSWVAHGVPLEKPSVSDAFDFEAEFVAVIGKGGKNIPKEKALDHVAGYSIFNDGSIRDYQFKSSQWIWGKNMDRTGGFGPEFVTADEVPPGMVGMGIELHLNGVVMQKGNTSDMIFDVATLVAACSEGIELHPGDMIITGTPAGVGMARTPPVYLKAGDVCDVIVEGLGTLSNPVINGA
jgi:2-keto-4-pentenoate hydratase/2-oxohepta-3-ene-1,7-dioic acid hydratase in catechol pathway